MSVGSWKTLATLTVAATAGVALVYEARSDRTGLQPESAAGEWFVDKARETGLTFRHFNGMAGELFLPEVMAPGVGVLDFDNDGDFDVFLPQGQLLATGSTLATALVPPTVPPRGRLFRNDLQVHSDGSRTLRFTDVTDTSGVNADRYGMGVAAGDVDNDGWVDLYITNFGRNQLFHNNGNGTFTDVSKESGTDGSGWSVSSAFVDYDRDGWLDLYVGNYLHYSIDTNVRCHSIAGMPDYCAPFVYSAQPSRLLHNNGDGTFIDVTTSAGMSREFGPTLGVATADFNGDGWLDIYAANDLQPNQLWINQRDGSFMNDAALAGAAVGLDGAPKSSMGVDAGDFDNDGDEDLFIGELTGQGSTLYVNDGTGLFEERSARAGVRNRSFPYTSFGAGWFDYDGDGWLDVLAVNGRVTRNLEALVPGDPFPLNQPNLLLRNLGNGSFEDVTGKAGSVFERSDVSRGAGFGDLDNDGDVDVVVANAAGPAVMLINEVGNRHHWMGLRLVGEGIDLVDGRPGPAEGRDMLGARVAVIRSDGSMLWRRARADGSYASANDPRVLVGLGRSSERPMVRVLWPSGRVEEWDEVLVDRYTTLIEGTGSDR